jgi:hypothetical protein
LEDANETFEIVAVVRRSGPAKGCRKTRTHVLTVTTERSPRAALALAEDDGLRRGIGLSTLMVLAAEADRGASLWGRTVGDSAPPFAMMQSSRWRHRRLPDWTVAVAQTVKASLDPI